MEINQTGLHKKRFPVLQHHPLMAIKVIVNGKYRELPPSLSVLGYLKSIGLEGRRVAVARNGEVVAAEMHGSAIIEDGDILEIVHPVGGG